MPHGSGVLAARRARHGTIVIVAEPDDTDILAGKADEPNILGAGAGPGLTYSMRE
jgi:hypothetical protein